MYLISTEGATHGYRRTRVFGRPFVSSITSSSPIQMAIWIATSTGLSERARTSRIAGPADVERWQSGNATSRTAAARFTTTRCTTRSRCSCDEI